MKICYIANGGSIHTVRWAKWFLRKGHEIHLITPECEPIEGVTIHHVPIDKGFFIPRPKIKSSIKKIIKEIEPDILHAHQVLGYGMYGALSGFHPFIVTAWGSDIFGLPNKSKGVRKTAKRTLEAADVITCMTQNMYDTLQNEYSLGDKLKQVRWGIDTDTFHRGYEKESSSLRKEMDIPDNAAIVISPRGMQEVYGNHLFIEAIPDILIEYPNIYFIFLRGGQKTPYENQIKHRAKELDIMANVRFVERLLEPKELAIYLNMSDISTSFVAYGQFGAVLLESMNCGCVQLASDIAIHSEKLTHMENGLLVDIDNKDEIVKMIIHYISHPEIKGSFYQINKELVAATESWQKNAGSTEDLYMALITSDKEKLKT